MKCTACGNENQPGAKFCVHCGVVLMAAPAAAFSPTSTSASTPPSSSATAQRPIAPAPTPAMPGATPVPPAAAVASTGAASAAMLEPTEPPVAAPSSRTIGLAVAAVAILAVIVAGGYLGYRLLAGEGAKQSTAAADSSNVAASPPAPAPPAEAPKDISPPTTQEASPTTATAPATSVPPESTASAASASTPASSPGASAMPGKPSDVAKAPTGIPKTAAPKTVPQPQPVPAIPPTPAPAPPAAAPSKAPAKAPAVVAQAPAVQGDRWQMLADEMARCKKEDLFSRFVCEQRTRAHYCEGYWGKVPQCPSTPPVEHGQ